MNSEPVFLIGTQVDEQDSGIYSASLDTVTGALSLHGVAAAVRRPTWLLADGANGLVFSVSELGNRGEGEGEVLSFRLAEKGHRLEPINRTPSLGGGPTHLTMKGHRTLFVANFGGANASAIRVAADGFLGSAVSTSKHTGSGPHHRQTSPHPHGVTLSPCSRFLLVPDMGNDQVVVHEFDSEAMRFSLDPVSRAPVPSGSGPRLIEFEPSGRFAYLLTELSAELHVFEWHEGGGELSHLCHVPLDESEAEGDPSAAGLALTRDGRFAIVSNRRSNELQVYLLDPQSGRPDLVQRISAGGERPWHVGFAPDEDWLLVSNQASNTVKSFRVERADGALSLIETGGVLEIPTPTCTVFVS